MSIYPTTGAEERKKKPTAQKNIKEHIEHLKNCKTNNPAVTRHESKKELRHIYNTHIITLSIRAMLEIV